MQPETAAWAAEEFGHAEMTDTRHGARLVKIAAAAAESPSGIVSSVFSDAAGLEGAQRFIRNPRIDHKEVGRASYRATARRATAEDFVFAPVDGSNVTVPCAAGSTKLGPVGSTSQGSRGLEVMNAIGVSPEGTPLGLLGQQWWVRGETSETTGVKPPKIRPLHKKETQHWFRAIQMSESAFEEEDVSTQRWYQLDAGADFGEMLCWLSETDVYGTVRAAQDRRVSTDGNDPAYLWETVGSAPLLGEFSLTVPGGPKRQRREARMELRFTEVTVRARDPSMQFREASVGAVLAREVGTAPANEEPIEWLLLTNYPVRSFDDARLVVYGYSLRWRVEAFHKTWKDVCGVEKTQITDACNQIMWASILAAVAMRTERLTHLARETPEVPATEELTQLEIDATILMQRPNGYDLGDIPTIGEAVLWIAKEGGYRGRKTSGGPPGTKVIGRGLRRIEIAAQVLAERDQRT